MNTAPQPVDDAAPPDGPPPQTVVLQLMNSYWIPQAINAVCHLGIPDLLAAGPQSAQALAQSASCDAGFLYRVLRSMASIGIFLLDGDDRFSLTAVGETLRSDTPGSMRNFAMFVGHPAHWQAWGSLLGAVQSGQDAFSAVHKMGFFEYGQQDPAFDQVFNAAMTSFSVMDGFAIKAAYDFAGIERLVDVGGGQGFLLGTILEAHPSLRGVLYDLPRVVEQAVPILRQAGVLDRCETVGGDFFDSVPDNADAYIMKTILHDWPDDRCIQILKNCATAMRPGGRVLVVDLVIAPANQADYGKFLDLEMLVMTQGGRERTEAEFVRLFTAAGLKLSRVVRTMSPNCILEAFRA